VCGAQYITFSKISSIEKSASSVTRTDGWRRLKIAEFCADYQQFNTTYLNAVYKLMWRFFKRLGQDMFWNRVELGLNKCKWQVLKFYISCDYY
jgi:hypothetical protein